MKVVHFQKGILANVDTKNFGLEQRSVKELPAKLGKRWGIQEHTVPNQSAESMV